MMLTAEGILKQHGARVIESLPSIGVPTLVIVGENDEAVPRRVCLHGEDPWRAGRRDRRRRPFTERHHREAVRRRGRKVPRRGWRLR
jgi:pimeloyl-ACP methyl ester carboxylesterase